LWVAIIVSVVVAGSRSITGLQSNGIVSVEAAFDDHVTDLTGDRAQRLHQPIVKAEEVSAHHSHPTGWIQLTFDVGDKPRYAIGADSDVANEFWLRDLNLPATFFNDVFRHFSSRELAVFLGSLSVDQPLTSRAAAARACDQYGRTA
jgi:hypothetical protein